MPNLAWPVETINRGPWTALTGSTTDIHLAIDDSVDTDGVQSAQDNNLPLEVGLGSVPPAVTPRAHRIEIRGRKSAANGNVRGLRVTLLQGSTPIGSQDFPDLPATIRQETINLPRAMAAEITDYADLALMFTPLGPTSGGSARRRVVITGAVLVVPAAPDLVDDLLARWNVTEETNATNPAIPAGEVWLSHSGSTGKGENRWEAIRLLFDEMKQRFPNSNLLEWRYRVAYALWKVIHYERIRAEIMASTYPLPPHQTNQEALDIVDEKIQTSIDDARSHDDEAQVPADITTTTTPEPISTTGPPLGPGTTTTQVP